MSIRHHDIGQTTVRLVHTKLCAVWNVKMKEEYQSCFVHRDSFANLVMLIIDEIQACICFQVLINVGMLEIGNMALDHNRMASLKV